MTDNDSVYIPTNSPHSCVAKFVLYEPAIDANRPQSRTFYSDRVGKGPQRLPLLACESDDDFASHGGINEIACLR